MKSWWIEVIWTCGWCRCRRSWLIIDEQIFLFINKEIHIHQNHSVKSLKTTKLSYQWWKADELRKSGLPIAVNLNFVVCSIVRLISSLVLTLSLMYGVSRLVSYLYMFCALRLCLSLLHVLCVTSLASCLTHCISILLQVEESYSLFCSTL